MLEQVDLRELLDHLVQEGHLELLDHLVQEGHLELLDHLEQVVLSVHQVQEVHQGQVVNKVN
jgi:hypothetical protein